MFSVRPIRNHPYGDYSCVFKVSNKQKWWKAAYVQWPTLYIRTHLKDNKASWKARRWPPGHFILQAFTGDHNHPKDNKNCVGILTTIHSTDIERIYRTQESQLKGSLPLNALPARVKLCVCSAVVEIFNRIRKISDHTQSHPMKLSVHLFMSDALQNKQIF